MLEPAPPTPARTAIASVAAAPEITIDKPAAPGPEPTRVEPQKPSAPPHEIAQAFGAGDPVIQIATPAYLATPSAAGALPGLADASAEKSGSAPLASTAPATPPAVIVARETPAEPKAAPPPAVAVEAPKPLPDKPAAAIASPPAVAVEKPLPRVIDDKPVAAVAIAAPPVAPAAKPAARLPRESEGFAGMPLPNLPTLAAREASDEPNPATAAAVETARNDAAASVEPVSAAATTAADAVAQAELRKATERTGLNDRQLARIADARQLLASGNAAQARTQLQELNAEFDNAAVIYIVGPGESLWRIAEKPEVYGNAFLWPLIWRANGDRMKEPSQLYKGMQLKVPANPGLDQVTAAIDYARQHSAEGLRPAGDGSQAAVP